MLTHFGDFLCGIRGMGSFKTDSSLWHTALGRCFLMLFSGLHMTAANHRRFGIHHFPVGRLFLLPVFHFIPSFSDSMSGRLVDKPPENYKIKEKGW